MLLLRAAASRLLRQHEVADIVERSEQLERSSASIELVLTDPPYYDAIPYSDLMDFFLRLAETYACRVIGLRSFRNFSRELSPKWDSDRSDGELIEDESRFGGDKKARKLLTKTEWPSLSVRRLQSLTPQPDGWLSFLPTRMLTLGRHLSAALIKGGCVVTASWPIQTEMPNRLSQRRVALRFHHPSGSSAASVPANAGIGLGQDGARPNAGHSFQPARNARRTQHPAILFRSRHSRSRLSLGGARTSARSLQRAQLREETGRRHDELSPSFSSRCGGSCSSSALASCQAFAK